MSPTMNTSRIVLVSVVCCLAYMVIVSAVFSMFYGIVYEVSENDVNMTVISKGNLLSSNKTVCKYDLLGQYNCSLELLDYPSLITLCQAFNFAVYIVWFPLTIALAICEYKDNHCGIAFGVVSSLIVMMMQTSSFLIYVEVVGPQMGFSWKDLTGLAYYAIAVYGLVDIILCVLVCYGILRYINIDWCKVPQPSRNATCKECHSPNNGNKDSFSAVTYQMCNIKAVANVNTVLQLDNIRIDRALANYKTCAEDISLLIDHLWDESKVGVGRDARYKSHNNIEILSVNQIQNNDLLHSYDNKKKAIVEFAESVGGRLHSPHEYMDGVKAVATDSIIQQLPNLRETVDTSINEFYLFHGTRPENVESIGVNGFKIGNSRMLGSGCYFADRPVKADQYAGSGDTCCIILCRVLLGDTVILKTRPGTNMSSAKSPPCKKCFAAATGDYQPSSKHFDSLLYDGGLFREYVIYDPYQAFPEFAVYYKRLNKHDH